tara:strand:- start:433 stop:915 length:483 start_codon:yes stop_codon:yes gene_type:complete
MFDSSRFTTPSTNDNFTVMSNSYQSIRLGGENRNAESLGDFVAWLVINNFLEADLEQRAGSKVARVKMQDLTGPAFLTTALDGELKPEHLTAKGRAFCEHYLVSGDYDRDYQQLELAEENDWLRYDAVAKRIREVFHTFNEPEAPLKKLVAKVIQFPKRK